MELDQSAWDRWEAYRKAIKKPIKQASVEAMKLKLSRYSDQNAVVDQSIANNWQGLFDVHQGKKDGPPKRTKEQQAASEANFEWQNQHSIRGWDSEIRKNPSLWKLVLSEALLARYDVEVDQSSTVLAEKRQWLKERVGQLLAECRDKQALQDFTVRRLVLRLFPNGGLYRLDKRLQECA